MDADHGGVCAAISAGVSLTRARIRVGHHGDAGMYPPAIAATSTPEPQ